MCFLLVAVLSPMAAGQGAKMGYVSSNKIFKELPEAQEAQRKIDAITKPVQDTLDAMERELAGRYEDYRKKESMMTEAAKKSEQESILQIEQRYRAYRAEKSDPEGDLARATDKILSPLKAKIIAGIEKVAKEEKYSFVFDKSDQVNILLYADPSNDLTFKVIDRLKRGGK